MQWNETDYYVEKAIVFFRDWNVTKIVENKSPFKRGKTKTFWVTFIKKDN